MPPADQPTIDRLTKTLLDAYARAGKLIDVELEALIDDETQRARRARLKALAADLDVLTARLGKQTQEWTDDELRQIYQLGAKVSADVAGVTFSWTQTHEAAVKAAARATNRMMLSATTHMTKDAKRLIRASSKEATLMKLLVGRTARQAGRQAARS